MGSYSLLGVKGSLSGTFPRRDGGKKNPLETNKKISQTTKHSASVLSQDSLLCFLPDCLPRNEEIIQRQDTGSFPLGQSFHGERRDQVDEKKKIFFHKKQGEEDVWNRWENVKG